MTVEEEASATGPLYSDAQPAGGGNGKVLWIKGRAALYDAVDSFTKEHTWASRAQEELHSLFSTDRRIIFLVAGYILLASCLSIVNKWALLVFPYPGSLLALQFATSAFCVWALGRFGALQHDHIELAKLSQFLPAAIVFYLALYGSTQLLLHANVDTAIVFRSAVPLVVAACDTIFLRSPFPSLNTWGSLLTILAGAGLYVLSEQAFSLSTWWWAAFYVAMMSVDAIVVKHVVTVVGLNTWGLVLYNNLEALLLYPIGLVVTREYSQIASLQREQAAGSSISFHVVLPVAISCAAGLLMSFFGLACRQATSATAFSVLGVTNKMLTVLVNLTIWNFHATIRGTLAIFVCLVGGVMYQQSLVKPVITGLQTIPEEDEEEG